MQGEVIDRSEPTGATAPGAADVDRWVDRHGAASVRACGLDAARWSIQAFRAADLPQVLDVESRSFAPFDRPTVEAMAGIYASPNGAVYGIGPLIKFLVRRDGRLLRGYTILQLRDDDAYILEMALSPSIGDEAGPRVGGVMLHAAARLAQDRGLRWVTANIRRLDRIGPLDGYSSRALVRHCRWHGLHETDERGRWASGQPADPDDAWLRGEPGALTSHLERLYTNDPGSPSDRWRCGPDSCSTSIDRRA